MSENPRPDHPAAPPPGPAATTAGDDAAASGGRPEAGAGRAERGSGSDPLRGSRTSGIWVALTLLTVLLVLLAVFVFQNTQTVTVSFFGWEGEAPLSAALLIATAAGALIVVTAGSLRILQLRRRVRRERKR